jgi:DNA uptake protein ComE-like DNA-binding protein
MRPGITNIKTRHSTLLREGGSVLIIVIWIVFGLISVALYFGHAMSMSLHAEDNRVASAEARLAIEGAARYISLVLTNLDTNGVLPDIHTYANEAVSVGNATYWLIGRNNSQAKDTPVFGLVDEASKLNINTASSNMLESLPNMTTELAEAIVNWRTTNTSTSDEVYQRNNPAYRCKKGEFESVDELRLVAGATMDILLGEDTNLNGVLDENENDGNITRPNDNQDGTLDQGLLELLTVYTREPNVRTNGSPRINVSRLSGTNITQLSELLRTSFDVSRANAILGRITAGTTFNSVLQFYIRTQMTPDELAKICTDITTRDEPFLKGLINVNTASEAVLACVPGIGIDNAPTLVAFRQANPDKLTSVAWVAEALDRADAIAAGPYITSRSYQFSADIAAVGHHGRGYQRVRYVFDITEGSAKVIYRQDLTHLGWALGKKVRQDFLLAKEK